MQLTILRASLESLLEYFELWKSDGTFAALQRACWWNFHHVEAGANANVPSLQRVSECLCWWCLCNRDFAYDVLVFISYMPFASCQPKYDTSGTSMTLVQPCRWPKRPSCHVLSRVQYQFEMIPLTGSGATILT